MESEERPWGFWHVLDVGEGYKVKRIHVQPGARLSYQTHEHRSEHWVVVTGVATCVIDGGMSIALAGHSIDVPLGAKHRLVNDGAEELVIIEVQRGPYTGEDDIVRHEDDYGWGGPRLTGAAVDGFSGRRNASPCRRGTLGTLRQPNRFAAKQDRTNQRARPAAVTPSMAPVSVRFQAWL